MLHRFVSLIFVCEFLFYFSPLLAAAARIPVHGPRKVSSTCHVVHRESRISCTDRYTFSIYDRGFRAWSVLPVPGFCVRTEFPPITSITGTMVGTQNGIQKTAASTVARAIVRRKLLWGGERTDEGGRHGKPQRNTRTAGNNRGGGDGTGEMLVV